MSSEIVEAFRRGASVAGSTDGVNVVIAIVYNQRTIDENGNPLTKTEPVFASINNEEIDEILKIWLEMVRRLHWLTGDNEDFAGFKTALEAERNRLHAAQS